MLTMHYQIKHQQLLTAQSVTKSSQTWLSTINNYSNHFITSIHRPDEATALYPFQTIIQIQYVIHNTVSFIGPN